MKEPTNTDRAAWARDALAVFTARTYGGDHPDTMNKSDLETAITDLIADLMHLAQQQGFNPYDLVLDGRNHFEAELAEEARP